jgi:4-diphosphocytidyl-2-C-methyl-D-erythritol kinase
LHPLGGIAAETAPAKVNLTLRVGGKRPDGYHNIESLVAFAGECDALRLTLADAPALSVDGPFVVQSGPAEDNLVIKAAHALGRDIPALKAGHFELTKNLPAAAGLGGGSSDAAAALRLLARLNDIGASDPRLHAAACAIGADVPVCLDPRARIMRGTGELLSEPLALPALHAVLVNPGIATATRDVFAAFDAMNPKQPVDLAVTPFPGSADAPALIAWLSRQSNDLEPAAISLHPVIGEALAALRSMPGCALARMSGSGATCFGLFDMRAAQAAARTLHGRHPDWWVRATIFSENLDGNAPA